MDTEKRITANGIEYWSHQKSGETYAVMPAERLCFGPLYYEEIFKIDENDLRFDGEDWEWLDAEPCRLVQINSMSSKQPEGGTVNDLIKEDI